MAASFCRRSFLNYKNCLFQTQKRTGYIVLLPETPEEVAEFNLASAEALPDFAKLDKNHCKHIVNKYCQQFSVGVWELQKNLNNRNLEKIDLFKHFFEPLETIRVPFLSTWGLTQSLYLSDISIMEPHVYQSIKNTVFQFRNSKFIWSNLYKISKQKLEAESSSYTDEQKQILKTFIHQGIQNGYGIEGLLKENLSLCWTILDSKSQSYISKMQNAKTLFKQLIIDKQFYEDSPLDLTRNTAINFDKAKQGPWLITLNYSIYSRYLEYCPSSEIRCNMWLNYNQLCSPRGEPKCNAVQDVENLRKQKFEYANILGFPSYAHLAMQNKMAENIENVQNFLKQLLEPAKICQEKELHLLEKFAYQHNFIGNIELWDFPYWKRMHLKHEHGIDENTLKDFLPFSQVLLGLIALCEQLFSITIEECPGVDVWDEDVRYFRVSDAKSKAHIGGFFLDPYARKNKLPGEGNLGWFVPIKQKSKVYSSLPLSSLIFSFSPPEEGKPSLLYYREVEILFEKFGEMLQHTLSEASFSHVSGRECTELDAWNMIKYFLKFWLSERGTLESISSHYESGESLPSQILDNLCNLKSHMAGTKLCQKIYISNLDLELNEKRDGCMDIAKKLWPEHYLFQLVPLDYHPYGMESIFVGSWAGSLYSNLWSMMLAADAFLAFEAVGFSNQDKISNLGKKFRSTFLSCGGTRLHKEIFREFRGRDPDPNSLIKYLGLHDTIITPQFEAESVLHDSTPVINK